MDKQTFRKRCKDMLNKKNRLVFHKKIENSIFKQLKNYNKILLYISLQNEVQTRSLILKLRQRKKEIFVPFMQDLSFKMVNYKLPLKKKKFNIYEPKSKNKTKIKIDVALVPIIGVDKKFKRIGFGKGMYDRFFDKLNYKPKIIFTQIYPCICLEDIGDEYDIQPDFYFSYNLAYHNRRNYGNRSGKLSRSIGYNRLFYSQKTR